MLKRLLRQPVTLVSATLLLLACSGDGPPLKLLSGPAPEESARSGQDVVFVDTLTVTDNVTKEQKTVSFDSLNYACQNVASSSDPCDTSILNTLNDLCTVKSLIAASRPLASPIAWGDVTVTRTTSVERAMFAIRAVWESQLAIGRLDQVIRPVLGLANEGNATLGTSIDACSTGLYQGTPRVAFLTTAFAELYHLEREALDVGIEEMVSIGDSGRELSGLDSSTHNIAPGGLPLSRRGAALLLAGGFDAFGDSPVNDTFCTQPDLTPDVKAAIAVFRDAAPSPAAVTGTLTTEQLLNDRGTLVFGGSVVQRLYDTYQFSPLNSGRSVQQHYGLTTDSFQRARNYLKEEIVKFRRSSFPAPARRLPGGRRPAVNYEPYAGVMSEPQVLDPAYYFAIARTPAHALHFQAPWANWDPPSFRPVLFSSAYPRRTRPQVDFVDAALSNAALYLSQQAFIADAAIRNQTMSPLSLLLGSGERAALVTAHKTQGFWIFGYQASDKLLIVNGEDYLRCALTGTSEGGVCTATVPGYSPVSYPNTYVGFPFGVKYTTSNIPAGRYYVLKPFRNLSAPQAGDYKVITGLDLRWESRTSQWPYRFVNQANNTPWIDPSYSFVYSPVVPWIQERVRDLLAPSKVWCKQPKFDCVFTNLDDKIPLEDELAADSDGVESSWKHYITLARAAANEADALGEDYINSGIRYTEQKLELELRAEEQLQRAETTLSEVRDACGADIDLTTLLAAIRDPAWCGTTGADCKLDIQRFAATAPYNEDPNIQRLAQCLNLGTNRLSVSLGKKPICYWSIGQNNVCNSNPSSCVGGQGGCAAGWTCVAPAAGLIGTCQVTCTSPAGCHGAMSTCVIPIGQTQGVCRALPGQCPSYVEPGAACTTVYPAGSLPPGAAIVGPSTALGYFDTPSESNSAGDFGKRCNAIAQARQNPDAASPLWDLIQAESFLHPYNLAQMQSRLDWEARYGGFSAVTVDGKARWTTGDAFGPNPSTLTAWPCGPDVPAKTSGIFSKTFACGTDATRAQGNYTLLRAVLGARALSGLEMGPLRRVPHDQGVAIENGVIDYGKTSADTLKFWNATFPVRQYVTPLNTGYRATACPTPNEGNGCNFWILENGTPVRATDTGTHAFGPFLGGSVALDTPSANIQIMAALRLGMPIFTPPESGPAIARAFGAVAASLLRSLADSAPTAKFKFTFSTADSGAVQAILERELQELLDFSVSDVERAIGELGPGHPYLASATPGATTDITIGIDDVLNGLELMCQTTLERPAIDLDTPPTVTTVEDLQAVSQYVKRTADRMRQQVGLTVLLNVPAKAVDALRGESAVGAYPQYGGAVATQISAVRTALLELLQKGGAVADEVAQIGAEVSNLHGYLKQNANRQKIDDLQFSATMTEQLARCAEAVASVPTIDPAGAAGRAMASMVTCSNSLSQINFAEGIRDLTKENDRLQSEVAISNFGGVFSTHATNMNTYTLQILQSIEAIDRGLAEIEALTVRAGGALTRALHQASFQAKSQAALTHAVGNLYTQKQMRYRRALINAKKLTVLAKRSIEQRLGTNLSSMTEDLPLVDAPANWEKQVCSFSGLKFNRLVSESSEPITGVIPQHGNYSEGFIGDYVTKLENVVESYRLAHNFHEGTDTAVVSLKNDVMNVRRSCLAPGPNLLYSTGNLSAIVPTGVISTFRGWDRQGCATTDPAFPGAAANCVTVTAQSQSFTKYFPNLQGYQLDFGAGALGTTTGLVQTTAVLGPGSYRFSWYTPDIQSGPGGVAGKVQGVTTVSMTPVLGTGGDWNRMGLIFTLSSAQAVTVGFLNQNSGATLVPFKVAGPMLEALPPSDYGATAFTPFSRTGSASLNIMQPVCEDRAGVTMRAKRWRRDCLRLCPDGFSDTCSTASSKSFCFYEAKFDVNQRDLQFGRLMQYSGFARGNFNYRIDTIGLNFVGTNIRDCSNSAAATSCFSAGFVPYSLYQNGPFYVRNESGNDFRAPIFDGAIEHARGLALERHVTNPIADTDRSLLQDYMRREFQGRPLDGNFVIRVWDEPGVSFDNIEDVQIILNYRYWTRFD